MVEKGNRRVGEERSGETRLPHWLCLATAVTIFLLLPLMVTSTSPVRPDISRLLPALFTPSPISPCNNFTHNVTCCAWTELQCSDGACVPSSALCDNKTDCQDGSDELGCSQTPCMDAKCDQMCKSTPNNASRCICFRGYTLKEENKTFSCVDIDECVIGAHFCSHDCINLNGTFKCSCRDGFQQMIRSGDNVCKADDQNIMVLYSSDTWIYSYSVEKHKVTPVVHAFHASKMDIDPSAEMVYWSSRHRVWRSFVPGAKNNTVSIGHGQFLGTKGIWRTRMSIAIDWTAGNLYWTSNDPVNVDKYLITVSKLDGRYAKTLVDDVTLATSVVVDPESGKMYWTSGGESPSIGTAWMNGMYQKTLLRLPENRSPSSLVLDHLSNGRLFWIDSKTNAIYSTYTDGTRVTKVLTTSAAQFPVALDVFENYLYWITKESNQLVRHEKFGKGETVTLVEHLINATALKVYHKRRVEVDIRKNSLYCRNQCTHLCLHVPRGYACSCPDGSKILLLLGELVCDTEKVPPTEDPLDCSCSDKNKVCNSTSPYHKCHCNATCDVTESTDDVTEYYTDTDDTTDSDEEIHYYPAPPPPPSLIYAYKFLILGVSVTSVFICFGLSFCKRPERSTRPSQTVSANRSNLGEEYSSPNFGQGGTTIVKNTGRNNGGDNPLYHTLPSSQDEDSDNQGSRQLLVH